MREEKMKKILLALILVVFCSGASFANTYTDNYYGTFDDGSYIDVYLNQSVTFDFNILDKGYDPSSEYIASAGLSFDFWSEDPQDETVSIYAGFYDGFTLITEQYYDLGGWWIFNQAATATLNIDLGSAGLLDLHSRWSVYLCSRYVARKPNRLGQ
jgi:hypothetical protein